MRPYHHGHLVEGGLAVEEDYVPILQMPLDLVAKLQVTVAVFAQVPQVKALPVLPHNVLGPRFSNRGVRPVLDQLLQPAATTVLESRFLRLAERRCFPIRRTILHMCCSGCLGVWNVHWPAQS